MRRALTRKPSPNEPRPGEGREGEGEAEAGGAGGCRGSGRSGPREGDGLACGLADGRGQIGGQTLAAPVSQRRPDVPALLHTLPGELRSAPPEGEILLRAPGAVGKLAETSGQVVAARCAPVDGVDGRGCRTCGEQDRGRDENKERHHPHDATRGQSRR